MERAGCWQPTDGGGKAFDLVVTGASNALSGCACFDEQWWKHRWMWEKLPFRQLLLPTPLLRFPISTGVKVCSLAAGHSGSVLTKLCLFPGLQSSQGKLGSRGETKQKGSTVSHTEAALQHIRLFYSMGVHFSLPRRAIAEKNKVFIETGPRDNKTTVVLSCVFFQFKCHFQLLLVVRCPPPPFFCFGYFLPHLLLSSLDSSSLSCAAVSTYSEWEPEESASSNRQITPHIYISATAPNFGDYAVCRWRSAAAGGQKRL